MSNPAGASQGSLKSPGDAQLDEKRSPASLAKKHELELKNTNPGFAVETSVFTRTLYFYRFLRAKVYIYINIWYMILYYVFFAGMAFAWAIPRRCNAFEAATLGSWCSPQSSDCTETQQVSQHENCVVSALCICTFPWFGMSWQVPIFWYMNLWGQSQNNFIQFLVQPV